MGKLIVINTEASKIEFVCQAWFCNNCRFENLCDNCPFILRVFKEEDNKRVFKRVELIPVSRPIDPEEIWSTTNLNKGIIKVEI